MEERIEISFPLDADGFIRRGCPACEREFRWLFAHEEDEATEPSERGFCCPYCGTWAQPDQWHTEAQVDHMRQVAFGAVADHVEQTLSGLNRPGSGLTYTPGDRPPEPVDLPPEGNDMRRVEFRCHPEDPLKVLNDWDRPAHCLICGTLA